jgi:hypothetical protein
VSLQLVSYAEPQQSPELASSSSPPAAAGQEEPEVTFYEGSGSNIELALSLLLGASLLFLPLTIASVGRRLWIKYKFTNKRLIVITNSPLVKREVCAWRSCGDAHVQTQCCLVPTRSYSLQMCQQEQFT